MKVITIHGIRRQQKWYETLRDLDAWKRTGVEVVNFEYGYFTLESFLLPWRRERAISEFLEFYSKQIQDGEIPSVVAHSFGTYILFKALSTYKVIKFDRIILVG